MRPRNQRPSAHPARGLTAAALIAAAVLTPASAHADTPVLRDTIAALRGNPPEPDALRSRIDEAFDDALAKQETDGDELARAHLDAAALLTESGMPAAALAHLSDADLWGRTAEVRANARFNYGHVRYLLATEAMKPDPEAERPGPDIDGAIAQLREASAAFRAVLDLEPGDQEAARNAERVRRSINALEEIKERARELAEQMRQQAEQADQLADRQQRESVENAQQAQSSQTASRDQSGLSEETEQLAQQMQSNPQGGEAMELMRRAMQQQQRAQNEIDDGDPTEASEEQLAAARALRQAAQALREQADQQDGGEQQGEQSEQSQQQSQQEGEGQPSEQEGESQSDIISQWLLDREERQREQRDRQLRAIRGQGTPVERDW